MKKGITNVSPIIVYIYCAFSLVLEKPVLLYIIILQIINLIGIMRNCSCGVCSIFPRYLRYQWCCVYMISDVGSKVLRSNAHRASNISCFSHWMYATREYRSDTRSRMLSKVRASTRRMAARHYARQYTMQLTEKKITDGNISSESSDIDDYYPLIHHSVSGTTLDRNARRRMIETGWDEVVRLYVCFFIVIISRAENV